MNTKIADFVSKRTDPYFFSSQEDAKLTDIHTEVKRSIDTPLNLKQRICGRLFHPDGVKPS